MDFAFDTLSAVFWGVLVLSLLVAVHEGGHFLVARACSVRVTEFYLGMPSRLKLFRKSRKHGTEFGITPILFGGYNRICGMESLDDELLANVLAHVYRVGSVRIADVCQAFSIDGDRAYAILMVLADWASIRMVEGADKDDPVFKTIPRDAALLCEYDKDHDHTAILDHADGDTYEIPLSADGFLEFERGHVYQGIPFPKRLAMLIMGPVVNILLALFIVVFALSAVGMEVGSTEAVIGSVHADSLAEQAGVLPGDVFLRIGEYGISNWQDISDSLDILLKEGEDFDIEVSRDGVTRVLFVDMPENEPVELLGVTNTVVTIRLPVGDALATAFQYAGQVAQFVVRLIDPAHTMETIGQSSSIVGMSVMASQAASAGLFDLLLVMAAISMSLGFMNLLPIPPLDGGKILFEVIRLIIGKPVSIKVQNIVSYVGLALLLILFIFVLRNDLIRYVM